MNGNLVLDITVAYDPETDYYETFVVAPELDGMARHHYHRVPTRALDVIRDIAQRVLGSLKLEAERKEEE